MPVSVQISFSEEAWLARLVESILFGRGHSTVKKEGKKEKKSD